jgi:hypothetical protein
MISTHTAAAIQSSLSSLPLKVELVIHHQCFGIELVSPVYASEGAACYLSPEQRVNVGCTTQADFNIDPFWREPFGSLMYKLQKKNIDQSNEDEETCIQLVIIWKITNFKRFCIYSCLIEHDKDRVWDEDRLMKLASGYKLLDIHAPVEVTCLMRDNTVLMKKVNVIHEEECYKLDITISKGIMKDDTWRLRYYDVDR